MGWGDDNGKGQNPWGSVPPGGGRGGGSGGPPPEYDDIIAKMQENFRNMMPGFLKGKGLPIILIVLGFVFLAYSSTFKVQPAEQGIVLRFGEFVRPAPQGLNFKFPYPIERVLIVNVAEVRQINIGYQPGMSKDERKRDRLLMRESLMLTGDENIVDIAFSVQWQIKNAENFLFNIQPPQSVTVKEVAESVMREIIGQSELQSTITTGRDEIEIAAKIKLQAVLDSYESGIEITQVNLEESAPPQQVIEAFNDVTAAKANNISIQNQAQGEANRIVPEARGQAEIMRQQAIAYKEQVVARATGEASRFLAVYEEYSKAKDVTKRRIYLETMEELLAGMNKIIIDESAGTGVVPYLPLPELRPNQDKGGDNE